MDLHLSESTHRPICHGPARSTLGPCSLLALLRREGLTGVWGVGVNSLQQNLDQDYPGSQGAGLVGLEPGSLGPG